MPAPRPDPLLTPELRAWLAAAGLGLKASYRVDEVAGLLSVSERCVYKMVYRGQLQSITETTTGARLTPTRVPITSLAALLDSPH